MKAEYGPNGIPDSEGEEEDEMFIPTSSAPILDSDDKLSSSKDQDDQAPEAMPQRMAISHKSTTTNCSIAFLEQDETLLSTSEKSSNDCGHTDDISANEAPDSSSISQQESNENMMIDRPDSPRLQVVVVASRLLSTAENEEQGTTEAHVSGMSLAEHQPPLNRNINAVPNESNEIEKIPTRNDLSTKHEEENAKEPQISESSPSQPHPAINDYDNSQPKASEEHTKKPDDDHSLKSSYPAALEETLFIPPQGSPQDNPLPGANSPTKSVPEDGPRPQHQPITETTHTTQTGPEDQHPPSSLQPKSPSKRRRSESEPRHPPPEELQSLQITCQPPSCSPPKHPKPATPGKRSLEDVLADLRTQKAELMAKFTALPDIAALLSEKHHSYSHTDTAALGSSSPTHSTLPLNVPLHSLATYHSKDEEVMGAAKSIVKKHIKLLHQYNEIKDAGQGLMGLIADQRGVRVVEIQEEFGVGVKD